MLYQYYKYNHIQQFHDEKCCITATSTTTFSNLMMKNAVSQLQAQPHSAISWWKMLYHNYKYNHIQQSHSQHYYILQLQLRLAMSRLTMLHRNYKYNLLC